MKNLATWLLVGTVVLVFGFSSCKEPAVQLAPPDWILGIWQSDTSNADAVYVRWEFTADNAIYEYHDPVNDIHSTVNLRTDFAGERIVGEVEDPEQNPYYYVIEVDFNVHEFSQEIDPETEQPVDATLLDFRTSANTQEWEWELIKQ